MTEEATVTQHKSITEFLVQKSQLYKIFLMIQNSLFNNPWQPKPYRQFWNSIWYLTNENECGLESVVRTLSVVDHGWMIKLTPGLCDMTSHGSTSWKCWCRFHEAHLANFPLNYHDDMLNTYRHAFTSRQLNITYASQTSCFMIHAKPDSQSSYKWTLGLPWITSLVTRQPLWHHVKFIFEGWN